MGRKSSVEKLPKSLRQKLHALLDQPGITIDEVKDQINDILIAEGEDELSRSAVGRYAKAQKEVASKMRESREVAKMLTSQINDVDQSEIGQLLNEIVRTMVFETGLKMTEAQEPASPKLLANLALTIQRLEKAAADNKKFRDQLVKEATQAAAEKADLAAKEFGLTEAGAKAIRNRILGIQ